MANGRSPYHYATGDRVIRRDSVRGRVLYTETLYAVVAWEDGTSEVLDQFSQSVMVEERGVVSDTSVEHLRDRLAQLNDQYDDIEWEIEDLQAQLRSLDETMSDLEAELEVAQEEAEALLARQEAEIAHMMAVATLSGGRSS